VEDFNGWRTRGRVGEIFDASLFPSVPFPRVIVARRRLISRCIRGHREATSEFRKDEGNVRGRTTRETRS